MNNQSCDTVNIVPARRKIGNTRISVSGLYPFKKDSAVAFESTLERDFLIRLEVDPNVTNRACLGKKATPLENGYAHLFLLIAICLNYALISFFSVHDKNR